ncbi:MAG: chloride channel protein [Thermoplasmata archaeon]
MTDLLGRIEKRFRLRIRRNLLNEYTVLILFAIVIGIAAGFVALGFRYLIWALQSLFFNAASPLGYPWLDPSNFLVSVDVYTKQGLWVILIPAFGGLLVGVLTSYLAPEAKGHGVPEVMAAVHAHGGRIRPRVAGVKALASAICIGSGGSAGREGPIVQIGSSIGSAIAQRFHLSDTRVKILLACGAAGGISATFNAPIAGVLFALELILLELRTRSFIPLVVSSVSASAIMGVFIPSSFALPQGYVFRPTIELAFFALLGILSGLAALLFIKALYSLEDLFDSIKFPRFALPALGGLVVGAIALFYPQILGVGYETVGFVLSIESLDTLQSIGWVASAGALFLILLAVMKIMATSLTLGSGGSGGIFAPSIFIGAMVGGSFGIVMRLLFPDIVTFPGAYALVGMGAVFAGASRATLTSIVIVFEITGDYQFILPLMFACVLSDAITLLASEETIYTKKLRKKGIRIEHDLEVNILKTITVEEAMVTDVMSVTEDTPIAKIANMIISTGYQGFPVKNETGELTGIIAHSDVSNALRQGRLNLKAGDLETRKIVAAYPDETLEEVLERMALKGVGHIPVVERFNPKNLVGLITRSDIIKVYKKKAMEEFPDGAFGGIER